MLSQLTRYYNSAKIFRFFIHHLDVYPHILRDLLEKRFNLSSYHRPRNIVLKLSATCNARCRFCYAQEETREDRSELSVEEWKRIIDQARRLGCYTVTFSGGEPILYPGLTELVRYARSKRMVPFTTTNGLKATPEKLRELEEAGLCALNFSIHGPREQHDALVGVPGAYDRLLAHAAFCGGETRIICVANHVLTQESIRHAWYEHVWAVMKDRGARAFNVLPVCAGSADKSYLLTEQDLAVVDELAKAPHVLMDTKNYSTPRCPAAREDLLVNNYGEVQPCPFIPISFGSSRDASLEEIYLRIQQHPMFRSESPVCMPARNHDFIDQYIIPAFSADRLPAPIEQIWPPSERARQADVSDARAPQVAPLP